MWLYCLHLCLYTTKMPGAQKRPLDSLKLDSQKVMNCHVGVRNQTRAISFSIYKQHSYLFIYNYSLTSFSPKTLFLHIRSSFNYWFSLPEARCSILFYFIVMNRRCMSLKREKFISRQSNLFYDGSCKNKKENRIKTTTKSNHVTSGKFRTAFNAYKIIKDYLKLPQNYV